MLRFIDRLPRLCSDSSLNGYAAQVSATLPRASFLVINMRLLLHIELGPARCCCSLVGLASKGLRGCE